LTPAQAAAEVLRRREAAGSLVKFVEWTTPRWSPGRIHYAICEQLERVARKEVDRLMLLCPPQHGKSVITSKRFPAWLLGTDPTLDIISASATADLANEFGGDVRDCVRSPEYQKLFATKLSESTQGKGRWITEEGGGYYAVGIGGALFGRGAGLGIIDDPFSTWEDAQSELSQKRALNWYKGTFYNRIRPGGAIVVIQHRTGENDLVGSLLEEQERGGDKWEIVKLTADFDNPPWPERYDSLALQRLKENMLPAMWNALYLQDPTPSDGTFFKKEHFIDYDELPKNLRLYGTTDGAVTPDGGDSTEHFVLGVDSSRNVYVLENWTGKTSADVWIDSMADMINKYSEPPWQGISCWFGESGSIRRAVEPFMLKRLSDRGAFCKIEWIPSIHDKETRALGFQAMMAMGKVFWPRNAKWKSRVQDQMLRFSNTSKVDDAVDALGLFGRGFKFVNAAKKSVARKVYEPIYSWLAG
jgi:predicted phage terminase large subunit-like protein